MGFINVLCVNIRVTILDMSGNIIEHNTCMSAHICKVKGCKDGKNNKAYGNDEQHTVWAHMATAHKILSPMSCSKCKKIDDSLFKKDRGSIYQSVRSWREKSLKYLGVISMAVAKGI